MGYRLIKSDDKVLRFTVIIYKDNKKDEELTTFFNFLVFQFQDQIIELLDKVLKGKEKEVTYNFNDTTIVINNQFTKIQDFLVKPNNESYTIDSKELYKLILKYSRIRKIEKVKKLLFMKEKEKIKLRYFFDYGTTGCLWFDGVIESKTALREMGLTKKTIDKSQKIAEKFQSCIDWNNGEEISNENDKSIFMKEANALYYEIQKELEKNYLIINEIDKCSNNKKKIDLKQICEELIKLIPEQKEKYEKCIAENNNKLLGHVYFGDEFTSSLIFLLKDYTEIEKIKKYCNFIEYMWKNGNNEVVNIVDVTIIEKLSVDSVIWGKFRNFISNEFKEYINTDLIPNNIMMKDVKK